MQPRFARDGGYNCPFRKTLNRDAIWSSADDDAGEFIGSAEEVLVGMGATLYRTGKADLMPGGNHVPEPSRARMLPGKDEEGVPVGSDEFEQHDRGLKVSTLGGRDGDDIARIDSGAYLTVERFDAERKTPP